jgi:8-oxo-dGTP pyrophosphatase MutT (NUDIX family)
MQSDLVSERKLELIRPRERRNARLTELLIPTRTRTPQSCEQVAAVCYRVRKSKIEFLLVQTRKGRWTFPKGGIVPGFTRAQSAALEAVEEGGVHGRIEETSFARYTLRKRGGPESEIVTYAFLCEVSRMSTPQEQNRRPTWFTPEKAQLRLKERRTGENGDELARVVERAVARIERVAAREQTVAEPLQRVQLEMSQATERGLIARFAMFRALGRGLKEGTHRVLEFEGEPDDDRHRTVRSGSSSPITFQPR